MDADASNAEREQFEKLESENQRIREEWDRQITAPKGESESNALDGTNVRVGLNWTEVEEKRNTNLRNGCVKSSQILTRCSTTTRYQQLPATHGFFGRCCLRRIRRLRATALVFL